MEGWRIIFTWKILNIFLNNFNILLNNLRNKHLSRKNSTYLGSKNGVCGNLLFVTNFLKQLFFGRNIFKQRDRQTNIQTHHCLIISPDAVWGYIGFGLVARRRRVRVRRKWLVNAITQKQMCRISSNFAGL